MPPQRPLSAEELAAFQRTLGEIVRELRKPVSNQDDFADRVGVYRSHMGQIEQGKLDFRLSTLLFVARALDLTPSQLLRLVEKRQSSERKANRKRAAPAPVHVEHEP